MRIERVTAKQGYDLWSTSYDETANPVVALDDRVMPPVLRVAPGERVLDAGCGTGRHAGRLLGMGAQVVGMDFSPGMLRVAQVRFPGLSLVAADLQQPWPLADASFDLVLCALVGEHLECLPPVSEEMYRVLRPDGRLVFSVYHPDMAAAGIEAHFDRDDVEYHLGALRHTTDDYLTALAQPGFAGITTAEYWGDEELARRIPRARKFLDKPVLLLLQARK